MKDAPRPFVHFPANAAARRFRRGLGGCKLLAGLLFIWLCANFAMTPFAVAAEDPEVARARAEVQRKYEADKRKAVALVRQGVVSIYNPTTTQINYSCRWIMWDGSYTGWSKVELPKNNSMLYAKPGALKLQIVFTSSGGGKKDYSLTGAQIPSEVKAGYADSMANSFAWGEDNDLDIFKGKPKKW